MNTSIPVSKATSWLRRAATVSTVLSVLGASASTAFALDLEVAVTEDAPVPDGYVSYRIVVGNDQASTVNDVDVVATVPAGAVVDLGQPLVAGVAGAVTPTCPWLVGSSGTCVETEDITFPLGDLTSGQSVVIELQYMLLSSATSDLSVTVTARGTTGSPTSQTAVAPLRMTQEGSLDISAHQQLFEAGEAIRFDLEFGNVGAASWSTSTLRADIPAGMTFVSASHGGTQVGSQVEWSLGARPAGTGGRRSFVVRAPMSPTRGDVYRTEAELLDSGTTIVATAEDVFAAGDRGGLRLEVAEAEINRSPSGRLNYRIVVANPNATSALDVELNLQPGRGTFLEDVDRVRGPDSVTTSCPWITGSSGSCSSSEWITWSIGQIPGGGFRVVEVPLDVVSAAPTSGTVIAPRVLLGALGMSGVAGTRPIVRHDATRHVELIVSASDQTVETGDEVRFDIHYGNRGPSDIFQTLEVRASLPPGLTFSGASAGGTQSGERVTWSVPSLRSGETGFVSFWATQAASARAGELHATRAEISRAGEALARAGDSVVVQPPPSLELSVVRDAEYRAPGDFVTHRIVVSNSGSRTVSNILLRAVAPETGFLQDVEESLPIPSCPWIVGSSSACSATEWISWPVFELDPGRSTVVHLPVWMGSSIAAGSLGSTKFEVAAEARVQGSKKLVTPVRPLEAHLSLGFSAQVASPGDRVQLEVVVGNAGSSALQTPSLSLLLPAELSFQSATDGGTFDATTSEIDWTLPPLPAGETMVRRATVSLPNLPAVDDGDLFEASVALYDGSERLFSASDSMVVFEDAPLEFEVARIQSGGDGDYQDFKVVVSNPTMLPVTDVVVRGRAPRDHFLDDFESSYPEASSCPWIAGSSGSCNRTEWIRWNLGTIDPGTSRVIDVPFQSTDDPTTGPLEAFFILEGGPEGPILGMRKAGWNSRAEGPQVVAALDADMLEPGATHTMELRFGNRSSSALPAVDLVAHLPEGTNFISASSGAMHNRGTGEVRWSLGPVPAGRTGSTWIRFRVDTSAQDESLSSFRVQLVGQSGTRGVLAEGEETAVVTTDVPLELTAELDRSPVPGGGWYSNLRYTISNPSNQRLEDVQLRVQVPMWTYLVDRTQVRPVLPSEPTEVPVTCPWLTGGSSRCAHNEWILREVGTLRAGETRVVEIPVLSFSNIPFGEVLDSRVRVSESSETFDLGRRVVLTADETEGVSLRVEMDQGVIAAGGRDDLVVSVGNPSAAAANGLLLEVLLPSALSTTEGPGRVVSFADGFQVPLGTLPAGQWYRDRFEIEAAPGLQRGTMLPVIVNLRGEDPVSDIVASVSAALQVDGNLRPVLGVSIGTPALITAGSVLTVTASVGNPTSVARTDVRLAAKPGEFTFVDASALTGGGDCQSLSGSSSTCNAAEWLSWPAAGLSPNGSLTWTFDSEVSTRVTAGTLMSHRFVLNDLNGPRQEVAIARTVGAGPRYVPGAAGIVDSDRDSFPDSWELRYGFDRLDPSDPSPDADPDGDGLVNLDEAGAGTNPFDEDTDGDDLTDGWEVENGLDPLADDADADPDQDGLSNVREFELSTDPRDPDSDGDGLRDGEDTEPNDPTLPTNTAPIASATAPDEVGIGLPFQLDASASADPDGDEIVFSWVQTSGPSVGAFDPEAASLELIAPDTSGELQFELTVTDDRIPALSDVVEVTVLVRDAVNNEPPVAVAEGSTEVRIGGLGFLDGRASTDPNGDSLSYRWRQTGGPTAKLTNPSEGATRFDAPQSEGTMTFELTVNDGLGGTDRTTADVRVVGAAEDSQWFALAVATARIEEGSGVLDGCASEPEGEVMHAWQQISGPTVALADPSACRTTFPAPESPGTLRFVLRVWIARTSGVPSVAEVVFVFDGADLEVESVTNPDEPPAIPDPSPRPSDDADSDPSCGCAAVPGRDAPGNGAAFLGFGLVLTALLRRPVRSARPRN